ncbi:ArdC family protein [Chitinophaga pinensis]|uniref:DUF1738 domain-containing protein n=1 Tax=Chitinophaga pinensis (strain ATCC 43595 / DSM 2588 / LMG 13176 / NBRC 15968 / NCIMB 11800 / UQM 2034) TaxID=485918 RepID=A0A979GZ86_CHIPD|nr:zincin-like metallopeptidase domain-containing protein [Chitinophaga pinensis]ACU63741.1 domain of unknown function DUF1738 [Chitinophaga pinensis DSM 2588]
MIQAPQTTFNRRDIHQQVTDTIIQQLEKGVIPWQKPWNGAENRLMALPKNLTTGKKYRGVNILLLWTSAFNNEFLTDEWGSFLQWQDKKEAVRKGEKGTMIVYFDTLEKEEDGELKKIPFLKQSVVFNRCQLASYDSAAENPNLLNDTSLVERIEQVDKFVTNTSAVIENLGFGAFYDRDDDKITMPYKEAFNNTEHCTATEGYYSALLHELTHWTGNSKRIDRKFGDNVYATEELVAELGAAFMCAEFGINVAEKSNTAAYIDYWLNVLKDNKHCLLTAASEASKAVDFLQGLQPT